MVASGAAAPTAWPRNGADARGARPAGVRRSGDLGRLAEPAPPRRTQVALDGRCSDSRCAAVTALATRRTRARSRPLAASAAARTAAAPGVERRSAGPRRALGDATRSTTRRAGARRGDGPPTADRTWRRVVVRPMNDLDPAPGSRAASPAPSSPAVDIGVQLRVDRSGGARVDEVAVHCVRRCPPTALRARRRARRSRTARHRRLGLEGTDTTLAQPPGLAARAVEALDAVGPGDDETTTSARPRDVTMGALVNFQARRRPASRAGCA